MRWGALIPADAPVNGANERVIEVPLAREVLDVGTPGPVLDAGCALVGLVQYGPRIRASVTHVTQNIASERLMTSVDQPISYVSHDLRRLRDLFCEGAFERTVCVSTLEHVGMQNEQYHAPNEADPDSMLKAVRHLADVTRRTILLTVPYCEPPVGNPCWRFIGAADVDEMRVALQLAGFSVQARYYGRTDAGGWWGGGSEPIAASRNGWPDSVNAIVCLRGTR